MQSIEIRLVPQPDDVALEQIRKNLRAYNQEKVGLYRPRTFAALARRTDGTLVGGIYAWLQWGWLYIDLVWVRADARGQGIGRQLLQRCEAYAEEQGLTRARLNTASFQGALAFYKRCGYQIYAELEMESPDGAEHVDYFMKKTLQDAP